MTDEKFFDELSSYINDAFNVAFGRKSDAYSIKHNNTTQKKPFNNKTTPMKCDTLKVPALHPMDTQSALPDQFSIPHRNLYESIEDYTSKTGKRFRMTKDQKSRELSREQAFNETWGLLGGTN